MLNWDQLENACAHCTRCSLCQTRKNVVFGVGPKNADIMFIGEGPGEQEDLQGEPFVGPAGKLLDDMLSIIDLNRHNCYIANIVKCRPPYNRDPQEGAEDFGSCGGVGVFPADVYSDVWLLSAGGWQLFSAISAKDTGVAGNLGGFGELDHAAGAVAATGGYCCCDIFAELCLRCTVGGAGGVALPS